MPCTFPPGLCWDGMDEEKHQVLLLPHAALPVSTPGECTCVSREMDGHHPWRPQQLLLLSTSQSKAESFPGMLN